MIPQLMKKNIPEITGMRGLAALYVVLLHVLVAWGGITGKPLPSEVKRYAFNHGWIGVDFFFVLSGFLLALPLLTKLDGVKTREFWGSYLMKRWLRIAPPYYLAILFTALLLGEIAYLVREPMDVFLHVLYLHTFSIDTFGTINPVFWTLGVEFQFYVLLPLLVVLLARRSWAAWLVALGGLTLSWRWMTYGGGGPSSWLSFTLPAFLIHFAFGILAARVYLSGWRLRPATTLALLGGSLSLIVFPLTHFNPNGSVSQGTSSLLANLSLRPLLALGFAGVILGACCGRSLYNRILSNRPAQWVGESSYSLYLTHVPILWALARNPSMVELGFTAYLGVGLLSCLAVAFAFYGLVERPSLRLRHWVTSVRRARDRKPMPPTPAAWGPTASRTPSSGLHPVPVPGSRPVPNGFAGSGWPGQANSMAVGLLRPGSPPLPPLHALDPTGPPRSND